MCSSLKVRGGDLTTNNTMAKKKATKKKKKGALGGPPIPEEWKDKTLEEIKELVEGLESEHAEAQRKRNATQQEHETLQSLIDVARHEILDTEMRIERKELEIENLRRDNAAELKVYEQKTNFIRFCHEGKLKELEACAVEAADRARDAHKRRSDAARAALTQREDDLVETKRTLTREADASDESNKDRLRRLEAALEAQIDQFERTSEEQLAELSRNLEERRARQVRLGENKLTSHVRDLSSAHEARMGGMEAYLLSVERRQEMDIESLRASIKRMEKAAVDRASLSDELRISNEVNGRKLEVCSTKADELRAKIKNKEKNLESMRSTNARLSATRARIKDGEKDLARLTQKYSEVEEERNDLNGFLEGAVERSGLRSRDEQARLAAKLEAQESANDLLDRNLEHICRSASSTLRAEDVEAAARKQLAERDEERERLVKKVAKAEAGYEKALRAARLDLVKNGVAADVADSIDVLGGPQK